MTGGTYLVFGDLHGRILPAFRLALAWQREHGERVDALLQVGDLGFFPDPTRLDKATRRHAEKDPLELGAQKVFDRSREADALFGEPDLPEGLWFTVGNHEDFDALEMLQHDAGCTPEDFPVDYYRRVRCIRDGRVVSLPGGLRVGALWGIDDRAPNARHGVPRPACIRPRSAAALAAASFDVLLTHESPRDAVFSDAGSEDITLILHLAWPAFAFFGHYGRWGQVTVPDFSPSRVHQLHGLELRGRSGCAEEGSVGVLRYGEDGGKFDYLDPDWLRTFTRHNWQHR
jgi:hypothetical protein